MAATTIRIQARDESRRAFNQARDNARGLSSALLALGPALAPVAAAGVAGVVALGSALAGAAVSAGVFALAVKPQADAIKNISSAQEAYNKAVKENGANSKEAKAAQDAYLNSMKGVPAATVATAKEFGKLKTEFKDWSNSLAGDTMPVLTKGIGVLRTILPTLTPIVKNTSKVFGELMDKLGQKVKGEGFKRFMDGVAKWADSGLKKVVNGVISIGKAVGGFVMGDGFKKFLEMGGQAGGDIGTILKKLAQFAMEFVKAAGPLAGLSFAALGFLADALNAIPQQVLEILAPTIMAIVTAIKVWRLAVIAYTAAQWLLNAALAANPIGLIIGLIAGLVTAIILLWKKNEGFRNAVIAVWNAIKSGIGAAIEWIKMAVGVAWDFLKNIFLNWTGPGLIIKHWSKIKSAVSTGISAVKNFFVNGFNAVKSFFQNIWNKISSIASSAINKVKSIISSGVSRVKSILSGLSSIVSQVSGFFSRMRSAVSEKISSLISTVKGIPGRVKSALGNLGGLLVSAGKNIIKGLISGVTSMIGSLKSKFSSITNMIPDWKGPMTVDAKLLTPNGKAIMNSLMKGVDTKIPAVKAQLEGLTDTIPTTINTGQAAAASRARTASAGMAPFTVVVQLGEKKVAELVVDPIRKAVKSNGGNVQAYLGA